MADKTLTVYFTSDLHGYIYPTDYRSRDERDVGLFSDTGCPMIPFRNARFPHGNGRGRKRYILHRKSMPLYLHP